MKNCERIYLKVLRALGYPASPRGVVFGSEEHQILEELIRLMNYAEEDMKGHKFHFASARSYNYLKDRYWIPYIAILLICEGEDKAVEYFSEKIEFEMHDFDKLYQSARGSAMVLEDWVRRGGIVTEDCLNKLLGWVNYRLALKKYQDVFDGETFRKIRLVFELCNAHEDSLKYVISKFLSARRYALKEIKKARELWMNILQTLSLTPDSFSTETG